MQLNQAQADHIAGIYFEGGYDSEIESYLMTEGFPIGYFASEYDSNPKFKLLIDACRIHARAFWERLLRQNVGNKSFNVPAWLNAVKGHSMTIYAEKQVPVAPGGNVTINLIQDARARLDAPLVVKEALGMIIEGNSNG